MSQTVHNGKTFSKKVVLLFLALALALSFTISPTQAARADDGGGTSQAAVKKVFMPVIHKRSRPASSGSASAVMLGVYPHSWWDPNPQGVIDREMRALDEWAGKKHSLAGVFHTFADASEGNIGYLLGTLWDNGYTPFVNLYIEASSASIASGQQDAKIQAWAKSYLSYAQGGSRTAYLAPLDEMNGNWYPYGGDPANFKAAFARIRQIFDQAGVPDESVIWVFAPNGYSRNGMAGFEEYYPGDDLVEAIGFSSYNYGTHPNNPYPKWETPDVIYTPYLNRIAAMAPGKPIFIAQTATTAFGGDKNAWLRDAYSLLASYPSVKGVMYYNDVPPGEGYDWTFYKPGSVSFPGYKEGVADPAYSYVSPGDLLP